MKTTTIHQLKKENRQRHHKNLAASMTQFFNFFRRIDASSSVLLCAGLSLAIHTFA